MARLQDRVACGCCVTLGFCLTNSLKFVRQICQTNFKGKKMIGDRAQMLVDAIDVALVQLGEALNRGQPPHTGKLGIKFVDESAEKLTPIVQRLRFTKVGNPLPLRLPSTRLSMRAARTGTFMINHEEVKKLLREAEYLIKTRKEINAKIKAVKHWELLFCRSNEVKVKESMERSSDLHASIIDNLRKRKTAATRVADREASGVETVFMSNKATEKRKKRGSR